MSDIDFRIAICTVETDLVYRMTRYLTQLYRDAEYHVVSVVEHLSHRIFLTKFYSRRIYESLARAQDNVEHILRDNGVEKIVKKILTGRTDKRINKYIVENKIDLVALTTIAKYDIEHLGSTARRIIKKINIPILLYTARSDPIITGKIRIAYINGEHLSETRPVEVIKSRHEVFEEAIPIEKIVEYSEMKHRLSSYELVIINRRPYIEYSLHQILWIPTLLV